MIKWSPVAVFLFMFVATAFGEVEVLSSNDYEIIFKLTIPPVEIDNEGFPRYEGCGFIESGESKIPMTRVMIGIPPESDLKLSLLDWSETRRPISKAMRFPTRVFPEKPAEVVVVGYIRSQRIAILELHPVQYDRATRSLRIHSEMTVKVDFVRPYGAPSVWSSYEREPEPFESLFKGKLLNYDRAKLWRKAPAPRTPSPAPPIEQGRRIKIYIEKTGVYRITARELKERWGVDLTGVDPRTFRLTCKGEELPIYVKGESDGRFDPDDYIEFLGVNPNYIYSRYNIYWLSYGVGRGLRVSALDGEPSSMIATYVTSFRSKIHFEEDHVHSILNHLPPDQVSPDNPFEWFDKLDHWFWTGIKNGGDKNEVLLPFKLFDVAKSFSRPKFKITLQGGTPTEHDILVLVNGIRIGRAQFPKQDIVTLSKTLPANSLIDATEGDNVIACVKIDTTREPNTAIYPYHVYINSFEVEYMRLYKAVHDALDFSSPEEKEVNRGELLEYSIQDFLAEDVDVFIHDGTRLLTIITNPSIDRVNLDEKEKRRFRKMLDVEKLDRVPEYAYTVRFQHRYENPIRFYAVSSRGALKPSLVEQKEERDLVSPSNSANYIIIAHPVFMESAQRLAEWRMTPQGGGFKAMVVDVTDIYDQFNYGIVHPKAIKAFLKYAYENWSPPKLAYVLILGDSTVDFHGVTKEVYDKPPELSGYIPTYFIWTSYGETSTDHRFATLSGSDALPDLYLGRIPVETIEQADEVVDKIIRYERDRPNGEWRRRIISIADDATTNSGDFIFKQSMSEIDRNYIPPGYENVKLFLDDIREEVESHPERYKGEFIGDIAKTMIVDALNKGAVLAQYAGHAGRFVWAHEIIFDRFGVMKLEPNEKIPFMLVYSCYNGYFDAMGQDSMAELLLRKPDAGIIGMFSATRQTYGSANDSLSKIVLNEIFQQGKRRIGQIAFDSKVELLLREGLGQLEVMMQYTLFGDPATKLSLPDYKIETKLDRYSFNPGDTIKVLPGKLIGNEDRNPSLFSGRLIAKVKMNNKTIASSETRVSGGRYPEINITLPKSLNPGEAILDLYAESSNEVAVGGAKINIGLPTIRDITYKIVGDKIQISCSVYGSSPVEKVFLYWTYPGMSSMQSLEMIQKGDGSFFGEIGSIPPGEKVTYEIQAIISNDRVASHKGTIEMPPLPNLSVVTSPPSQPLIYFDGTTLVAEVQWNGKKPDSPVDVALFEGNPDRDKDGEVDTDVKEIGRVRIQKTDWVRHDPRKRETPSVQMRTFKEDPLNDNWLARANFDFNLPPGEGLFFVWIDPENRIKEADEADNLRWVKLRLETFNLDGSGELDDPQARFHLLIPQGAVEGKTITVKLENSLPGEGQLGLKMLPLAGGMKVVEISSKTDRFKSPLTLHLSFSYERLAQQIRKEIGLNYTESLLRQAIEEFLQASSIYLWLPQVDRWKRINSKLELDGSGEPRLKSAVTLVTSENEGTGRMLEDSSWAEENTPFSDWILVFTYGNMRLIKLDENIEDFGTSTGYFQNAGLHLKVQSDPKKPFKAGDSIFFSTLPSSSGKTILGGLRTRNSGDGIVKILSVDPNAPDDVWTLIFLDGERFTVVGAKKGLVRSADGRTVIGRVSEKFRLNDMGISMRIDPGFTAFRKGDTIKIVVRKVGVVKAEIDRPGIYAIMRSYDETPPNISVSVNGKDFADGDYVSGKPNFTISLRDDSGIDPESVKLTLVRNLIERVEVRNDEILISPSKSGVVTVNYMPKLDPAKYELTVKCADLDGHIAEERVEFVVSKRVGMSDVMSYPNPFSDKTEITCILSSEMDELLFKIYTLSGRLIWRKRLTGEVGFVQISWDGRDQDGREVANGVYYCKVTAKRDGRSFTKVIKLMRLR